jgi:FkbM family methyltransferase
MLAGLVGPNGHVYAFEPLPRNSSLLKRSVAENQFENRITVAAAAVGAKPGNLQLISPRKTNNWGGPYLRTADVPVPFGHEAQFVSVVQLDSYPLRRPISFIKLDAEGAELMVFQGARTLLKTDRPLVLAEINPEQLRNVSHCSANELLQEMASLGYACSVLQRGGSLAEITRYETGILSNVVFRPKEALT